MSLFPPNAGFIPRKDLWGRPTSHAGRLREEHLGDPKKLILPTTFSWCLWDERNWMESAILGILVKLGQQ
jgi:hypothetical protein